MDDCGNRNNIVFRYLHGLSEYGRQQGKTITPFVLPIVFAEAENSNGLLKVLIYLGCVMLFCNAPFLNNQKPYMILRCKRKGWYLGENMYVWLAAFLYMLFISLISLIAVLPTVSTNRLWGEIAGDFVCKSKKLNSSLYVGTSNASTSNTKLLSFSCIYIHFYCWMVKYSFHW